MGHAAERGGAEAARLAAEQKLVEAQKRLHSVELDLLQSKWFLDTIPQSVMHHFVFGHAEPDLACLICENATLDELAADWARECKQLQAEVCRLKGLVETWESSHDARNRCRSQAGGLSDA